VSQSVVFGCWLFVNAEFLFRFCRKQTSVFFKEKKMRVPLCRGKLCWIVVFVVRVVIWNFRSYVL
jgi:hypothetical protein